MNRKFLFHMMLIVLGVCLVIIGTTTAQEPDESEESEEPVAETTTASASDNLDLDGILSEFVGARECGGCHRGDFRDMFDASHHALTLQDATDEDTVMLADFTQAEDLRTVQFPNEESPRPFTAEDVALVMGAGTYAQDYIYLGEDGVYRLFPAQWNAVDSVWQPLALADDWLDPAYDWGQNCAGCHTTGYNPTTTEWVNLGVQCEACHGAGLAHVEAVDDLPRHPEPEELNAVRDAIHIPDAQTCGQCHSGGTSTTGDMAFPVGFVAGNDLQASFTLAPLDDAAHWWSTGHARTPNMQYNEWFNTKHATALTDLLASDDAEDACLECHSADYRQRQAEIAAFEAGEWEGSEPLALTLAEATNGITCSSCHQTHGETGFDTNLVDEPYTLCTSCHRDTDLTDEVHHPAQEMYEGHTAFDDIAGSPSSHFTAEDGPDCVTCHMPDVPTGDGSRTSHAMQPVLPTGDDSPPDTCTACHTDLSPSYMAQFVEDTQSKVSSRLEAVETALANNPSAPTWVSEAIQFVATDGSLGVHNYAYTDALLDAVSIELGVVETASANLPADMVQIADPATCEECHRDEVRSWQDSPHANASLNNTFLTEFADKGRPGYCMNCHASGYDASTGTHQFEGVTCTSCHIMPNGTEHPPEPVEIATDSSVCGTCHSGAHAPTYDEWLVSDHKIAGVDCVDCHTPHDNGLILGDVNTTCGGCHVEALTDEVHMGQDMDCTDCHMTRRTNENDTHVLTTGHTMSIDPNICSDCHGNTHLLTVRDNNQHQVDVDQVAELENEISNIEDQAEKDRNSGIIGGALGALLVMLILFILYRFRSLF